MDVLVRPFPAGGLHELEVLRDGGGLPRDLCEAAGGRQVQLAPLGDLARGEAVGVPSDERVHRLPRVRGDHHDAPVGGGADQAGGREPAGEHPARHVEALALELAVPVEQQGGRVAVGRHRLGPHGRHHQGGPGRHRAEHVLRRGGVHGHARERPAQLLGRAVHAAGAGPQRRAAALGAPEAALPGAAPPARHLPVPGGPRVAEAQRPRADAAAGGRAAPLAHQGGDEAGPGHLHEHRARPWSEQRGAGGGPGGLRQPRPLRERVARRLPGVGGGDDPWPELALGRAGGAQVQQPARLDEPLHRDGPGGPGEEQRRAGRAGPLQHDLSGVEVGRAGFCPRVVAVVPEHHQPQVAHGRPHGGPGAGHDAPGAAQRGQVGAVPGRVAVLGADPRVGVLPHVLVEGGAEPVEVAVVGHQQQDAAARGGHRARQGGQRARLVPFEQARGHDGGRPRGVPGQHGGHERGAPLEGLPHRGHEALLRRGRLRALGVRAGQRHRVVRGGFRVLRQGGLLDLRDARGHRGPQHVRDDAGLAAGHRASGRQDLLRQRRDGGEHAGELGELGAGGRLLLPRDEPARHGPSAEADGHAGAGDRPGVQGHGHEIVELAVQVRHGRVQQDACDRPLRPPLGPLRQSGRVLRLREGEQRVRDARLRVRGRPRRAAARRGPCAPT